MIKPAWKIWIYISEPVFSFLVLVLIFQMCGSESIGKGISSSYVMLLVLIGFCLTFSLTLYGFFFHRTVSFLGRVLRKAGYYRIFNYGFLAPICIHFLSGLFTFLSGLLPEQTWLHNVTFFFLIYSAVTIFTSVQNISGFARICMDLEAEIQKVDNDLKVMSSQ